MHFFLYEVVYRVVALSACLWCGQRVWCGFTERKITLYNTDILDWWTPDFVFRRDAMPIRYWITMCGAAAMSALCLLAAIVGYWQPNS